MDFIPTSPKVSDNIPYYEDVRGEDGWSGQGTGKSIEKLKSEIVTAVSRLGGIVSGFQEGNFVMEGINRQGYRVHYSIQTDTGKYAPGQIDIAALPVKNTSTRANSAYETKKTSSMKMALYMFAQAINGLWFLQQLSPGYAPLMPFMLMEKGKTVSQMWSENNIMKKLLPPSDSSFIDGEYKEL